MINRRRLIASLPVTLAACATAPGSSHRTALTPVAAVEFSNAPIAPAPLIDRMRHYGVPGLSVAILRNGEITQTDCFGVVTPGAAAITARTQFQAASLSKPITATALISPPT